METKVKTDLTPAQAVINTYPTFTQIFEHALKKVSNLKGHMTHRFYTTLPEEYRWEAVTDLIDLMIESYLGRPFHKTYGIKVNKKTGFSSQLHNSAKVYDSNGQIKEVDGDQYLALLKIMAYTWLSMYNDFPYTDEIDDAQINFKGSDFKIYQILD